MKLEKVCKIISYCMNNNDINTAVSFLQSEINKIIRNNEFDENRYNTEILKEIENLKIIRDAKNDLQKNK